MFEETEIRCQRVVTEANVQGTFDTLRELPEIHFGIGVITTGPLISTHTLLWCQLYVRELNLVLLLTRDMARVFFAELPKSGVLERCVCFDFYNMMFDLMFLFREGIVLNWSLLRDGYVAAVKSQLGETKLDVIAYSHGILPNEDTKGRKDKIIEEHSLLCEGDATLFWKSLGMHFVSEIKYLAREVYAAHYVTEIMYQKYREKVGEAAETILRNEVKSAYLLAKTNCRGVKVNEGALREYAEKMSVENKELESSLLEQIRKGLGWTKVVGGFRA
jgi:hypothetical protein